MSRTVRETRVLSWETPPVPAGWPLSPHRLSHGRRRRRHRRSHLLRAVTQRYLPLRARKPRAWSRWTKTGTAINVRWDEPARKPETWEKWVKASPGPPDLALRGGFQSVGGSGDTALGGGAPTSGAVSGGQRAEQRARYRVDGYSNECPRHRHRRQRLLAPQETTSG